MSHVVSHAPGTFNWLELGTTDQHAAKQFYGALLGWQAHDDPIGPNSFYTTFQLDGRAAAACYSLADTTPGAPPNWGIYIAVEDADASAARAVELGGRVLKSAFDVYTFGRMAVIQDPAGAVFSVWQPKSHIGTGITGVNGTLCWADLNIDDRRAAKAFYEQLFGWEIVPGKDKTIEDYLHLKNGEEFIGGIPPDSDGDPNAPPHWLIYFLVADCDASTAQVKDLGGKIYAPPMTVEKTLRFSVVADPQGAVFALFTSLH